MGTNYYAHVNVCKCCKHPEKKLHIGKSSYGWTFTFHAVRDYESLDGIAIDSWKRWQEVLKKIDVEIVNECDEAVGKDEFIEIVESKKAEKLNHYHECIGKYGGAYDDGVFLDPEGQAFCWGEFS